MKNIYSIISCCIISAVFIFYRVSYIQNNADESFKVTTWDALGYYMYLPATFIYKDVSQLEWFPKIDEKYDLTKGDFYQASKKNNDNYVFRYLGGVSILQLPFFGVAHTFAKHSDYEADGFSKPYQYAVAFGAVFYGILGVFLLRILLLYFFDDWVTAVSILLMGLATNLIQYISVDGALSHAFIFPLYALILLTSLKWHQKPSVFWAALTGFVIGLAVISRPTEIIMLFIPLLWNTHSLIAKKQKWALVRQHKSHIFYAILFGIIAVLPQLIYWKIATGNFFHTVGSKWFFLNPFFRVLVGFENGWFIYTPITIFFVLGFFFIKKYPFKNSVLTFCLLNIWIIIAWSDWKYGGTYSTRALVQSYPVFALAFAAVIYKIMETKWRFAFYILSAYLIFVNLFQIDQYNKTILHYRDMNRLYYSKIYLNNDPSPLEMSLLDTEEFIENEDDFEWDYFIQNDTVMDLNCVGNTSCLILKRPFQNKFFNRETWLKISVHIDANFGIYDSFLNCKIENKDKSKQRKIRLFNAIKKVGDWKLYEFYMKVPDDFEEGDLSLSVLSGRGFSGIVARTKVYILTKK